MSAQDAQIINIAKDSLDALSIVFEMGSGFSDVSQILRFSGSLVSAFPLVGAILSLVGNFLPNGQHEEILSSLNHLSNQINLVRDDIKNLGEELGWQQTEHHYRDAVNYIELGIRYCLNIGRAEGPNRTHVAKNRLKKLCANEKCTLDLNNLLKGITGKGLLTSSSILDKFDAAKAKGHRNKISSLATRLLQVATGGILVISTYEVIEHGEEEAKHYLEQHEYKSLLEDACRKAQSVLDRFVNNLEENMLVDLNSFLDKGGSNKDLATDISPFMSDKYDWLENFVLVYDDIWGSDNHWIDGQCVISLHRNGKCGIVFYRTKGEPAIFSNRHDEVKDRLTGILTSDAKRHYEFIERGMAEKGILLRGLAVIGFRREISWLTGIKFYPVNLHWKGTFPTNTVAIVVGKILYHRIGIYAPTQFVFLQ